MAALLAWSGSAQADEASCKEFRDNIVKMEKESIRPPGWFSLNNYLRTLYDKDCIEHPTRKRPVEYWYREDGTSTDVLSTQDRPADAAYATTKEIGDACLRAAGPMTPGAQGKMIRANLDPSICALDGGAVAACTNPIDDQERVHCSMILGSAAKVAAIPKGEGLGPIAVGLEGGPWILDQECQSALSGFGSDLAFDDSGAKNRSGWLATMRAHCPDFLEAIEKRAGVKAGDAARFWPAFGELLLHGFATPQTIQDQKKRAAGGFITKDPNFQRMCKQADDNRQECRARQARMGSVNGSTDGTGGQAGKFQECATLYEQVYAMCRSSERQSGRVEKAAAAKAPPPPAPQPKPQPQAQPQPQPQSQPQPKPADGTAQSRPPPASLTGMSAACKGQLNQLLAASDRRDGAGATAAYENLRANCDTGARGVAGDANMALPERQMGSLSRHYFGNCVSGQDCGTAPSSADQTARAAANAFNVDEVLNFAFAAAGLAVGVAGFYVPSPGGAIVSSNRFSTINQRARPTYGQGGPTHVAPPTGQSHITGKEFGDDLPARPRR